MFDLFLKAVGTFFVEGHEALPCTGYASPEYPCKRLIVNGAILSQQKSGEVGTLYSYNLSVHIRRIVAYVGNYSANAGRKTG